MTQVNPEPAKPSLDTTLEVPEIDDLSHITLHQVKNLRLEALLFFLTKQSFVHVPLEVSLESFPCFDIAACTAFEA